MNTTAPNLTKSEASLEARASASAVAAGRTSRMMFRLKRFADAIAITEAGTSAPIAIAASAKPAKAGGNICWKSAGTAPFTP
jgi:hypothetical protein